MTHAHERPEPVRTRRVVTTLPGLAGAFAVTGFVLLAMDACWLTLAASRLYRPALGALMREDFDVLAAALFYAIYVAGVVAFAVVPADSSRMAWLRGAALGFVAYATYDLTNQATLHGWPWHLSVIDMLWGTVLTSTAALAAHRLLARPR